MDNSTKILIHRKKIDRLNIDILKLINKRFEVIESIQTLKDKEERPFRDPERESEMMDNLLAENKGPLKEEHLKEIFSTLFRISLEHMKKEN